MLLFGYVARDRHFQGHHGTSENQGGGRKGKD